MILNKQKMSRHKFQSFLEGLFGEVEFKVDNTYCPQITKFHAKEFQGAVVAHWQAGKGWVINLGKEVSDNFQNLIDDEMHNALKNIGIDFFDYNPDDVVKDLKEQTSGYENYSTLMLSYYVKNWFRTQARKRIIYQRKAYG